MQARKRSEVEAVRRYSHPGGALMPGAAVKSPAPSYTKGSARDGPKGVFSDSVRTSCKCRVVRARR